MNEPTAAQAITATLADAPPLGARPMLARLQARISDRFRNLIAECLARPENEDVLTELSRSKPPLRLMLALGFALTECPRMVIEVHGRGLTVHRIGGPASGGDEHDDRALAALLAVGFKASSLGASLLCDTWHWSPPPNEPDLQWSPK